MVVAPVSATHPDARDQPVGRVEHLLARWFDLDPTCLPLWRTPHARLPMIGVVKDSEERSCHGLQLHMFMRHHRGGVDPKAS